MAFSTEWIQTGLPCIYLYMSLLLSYLIWTICTHEHYPIGSSRPQTRVCKPLFPAFFSQFLHFSHLMNNTFSHMIKGICVFSVLPIWAFTNNAKHRHLAFLLLISMEKNHFCPPAAFRASSESRVCKQPIIFFRSSESSLPWGALLNFQWARESDNTKFNTPAPHSLLRPCSTNDMTPGREKG